MVIVFIHEPLFQTIVLQRLWELLSVFPCCPTSVDPIFLQILQELVAGEVVVEEHVVILVLQIFSQLLHHVCPKSYQSLFSLAGVNIKVAKIAVGTISRYPHFDSTLDRLLWHVLFQARMTLKLDRCLIYSYLLRWFIECCKIVAEMVDQGSNLAKPVMCWITAWNKMVIIHKV